MPIGKWPFYPVVSRAEEGWAYARYSTHIHYFEPIWGFRPGPDSWSLEFDAVCTRWGAARGWYHFLPYSAIKLAALEDDICAHCWDLVGEGFWRCGPILSAG